ncbi:MAG: GlmU family protein [Flavobacteriaceae bacterium]
MNYILFDGPNRDALKPLTFTRPVADLRIGGSTIREKYEFLLGSTTSTITEDYLANRYPMVEFELNILIDASFVATEELCDAVADLKENQKLVYNNRLVAFYLKEGQEPDLEHFSAVEFSANLIEIKAPYDLFAFNDHVSRLDFDRMTADRTSQEIDSSNRVIGAHQVFIEEGASVRLSTINAETGPVFIGKDALVMEGSLIRGPLFLGEGSVLKMGAKIYGPVSVGPKCTLGGEIKNSVIFGYSSKGHEGYLGDSVLGQWCNLGADTNNSNLKNNYAEVKLWDYETERFQATGHQFCGLIMGDHSKCGINTMFNTGTVTGVAANIFGAGYQRNFIPSFAWGGSGKFITYRMNKVTETAELVMKRKGQSFDADEAAILEAVFEETSTFRNWEK